MLSKYTLHIFFLSVSGISVICPFMHLLNQIFYRVTITFWKLYHTVGLCTGQNIGVLFFNIKKKPEDSFMV